MFWMLVICFVVGCVVTLYIVVQCLCAEIRIPERGNPYKILLIEFLTRRKMGKMVLMAFAVLLLLFIFVWLSLTIFVPLFS